MEASITFKEPVLVSESSSTVTRKGQVTVPIRIRRALGLKQGDQVAFALEDGAARLTRSRSYAERTKGVVKTSQPPLTAEQLRAQAEAAIAEGAIERGGG
jgi:AbrB family looped-hinge helix DNA binding protein